MTWRGSQSDSRARALRQFDAAEAAGWAKAMPPALEAAYQEDLSKAFTFAEGMEVLEVGAGGGQFTQVLAKFPGLKLTAMDPMPTMLGELQKQPQLQAVATVEGFCDAVADRPHFAEASFDLIASRQLANGLYDPLAAFQNWHHWLKPGGSVLLVDGLFDRNAWGGKWADELHVFPLSATQSMALVPYLLESVGFVVQAVARMEATQALTTNGVERYLVVAQKPRQAPLEA